MTLESTIQCPCARSRIRYIVLKDNLLITGRIVLLFPNKALSQFYTSVY